MRRAVVFFMTGPAHLPYLVVALNTLRRHWSGDVLVFAWEKFSDWGVEEIANRNTFDIVPIKWEPSYTRKNAQEMEKMRAIITLKGLVDSVVYLDADIIVAGGIEELFEAAEQDEFCATQFCNWTMSQKVPHSRISRMLNRDVPQDLVLRALEPQRLSWNSGIFSCIPESAVLPPWLEYTIAVKDIYISGETSLHAIMCDDTLKKTWRDGRYNCSTMRFQSHPDEEVVIWHGHGDSFCKRSQDEKTGEWGFKSDKGWEMWSKEYQFCKDRNLGGVRDWEHLCKNQHLDRMAGRL